jgi:hypothetical protein
LGRASEEIFMPEVLAVEMAALLLALLSIGAADFVYHSGWIAQSFHTLWVASSIATMCLPILKWVAGVFVGPGVMAWGAVAVIETAFFVSLYRNLSSQRESDKLGHSLPPAQDSRPPAAG